MEYGASKKRKKQIDKAVEEAMGPSKKKAKPKPKKKKREGGMSADDIAKFFNNMKQK